MCGIEVTLALILSGMIQKGVIGQFNFDDFAESKFLDFHKSFVPI
jgi:hypothetical protein